MNRYQKQILFDPIGPDGQEHIAQASVLIVGCGALGSVLAETMVRAGVGHVRIVDRDFVEWSNLQRQVLYDEADVRNQLPKAVAAAHKLRAINSEVTIDEHVADVGPENIVALCEDVDLILDGTDNFEVRFLINDASLELGIPWINGGCVGSHGQVMTILPGETACLRCLMEHPPDAGSMETCDTAGVIGPAVNIVASLQSVAALKLLAGRRELIEPELTVIDVWDGSYRRLNLADLRDRSNCPACVQGKRDWLHGQRSAKSTVLCGRNSVQVSPGEPMNLSLDDLAKKLSDVGTVTANPYLLKLSPSDGELELTLFKDGRVIVQGTDDPAVARSAYARYIGT